MIIKATFNFLRPNLVRKSLQVLERKYSMENKSIPEEVNIPIPYGHISGELWNGSGNETPILAVHGWLDSAATWDTLLPLINPNFPVLAIDLPGHGLSSPRPAGIAGSFLENVVMLDRVINFFKWDKVILMGHSMGASINSLYAGTVPEKVSRLIHIDGGILMVSETKNLPINTARTLKNLPIAESMLNSTPPMYSYNDIVDKLVTSYKGKVTVESAKCLLRRGAKKHADDLYHFSYSPLERVFFPISLTFDMLSSYLCRINCEVLFVKASLSEDYGEKFAITFREGMKIVKENCKSFEGIELEGRHHLHLNDPVPVSEAVNRFLAGQPQNKDILLDTSKF